MMLKYNVILRILIFCAVVVLLILSNDGRQQKISQNPTYKIGAYYFGTFNPLWTEIIPRSERLYKTTDLYWWAGVRQLFENSSQMPQLFPESLLEFHDDFTHMKPVIGYYDLRDKRVIQSHIQQAYENGLTYFNFYFYWDALHNSPYSGSDVINQFVQAPNSKLLHFMVSIWSHAYGGGLPEEQFDNVVDYIVTHYFVQSNYLKTDSGQPFFQLGDTAGFGAYSSGTPLISSERIAVVQRFIHKLKKRTLEVIGKEPFIVLNIENKMTLALSNDVDGYTCILSNDIEVEGVKKIPYDSFVGTQTDYLGRTLRRLPRNKSFIPCWMENFDERPRVGWEGKTDFLYTTHFSLSSFQAALVQLRDWMYQENAQARNTNNLLNMYAWNEWHEGGILEPDVHNGASKLAIIADVFHLPHSDTNECGLSGKCLQEDLTAKTPDIAKLNILLGAVDAPSVDVYGNLTIPGWACVIADNHALKLQLEIGDDASRKIYKTTSNTVGNEAAVDQVCRLTGPHRFAFTLSKDETKQFEGKAIFVRALYNDNPFLNGSGIVRISSDTGLGNH